MYGRFGTARVECDPMPATRFLWVDFYHCVVLDLMPRSEPNSDCFLAKMGKHSLYVLMVSVERASCFFAINHSESSQRLFIWHFCDHGDAGKSAVSMLPVSLIDTLDGMFHDA